MVSRSGYYRWIQYRICKRRLENIGLSTVVKRIFIESRGTYGSRRISGELKDMGIMCGRYRAGGLMRLAGVSVVHRKKYRSTTDSRHNLPVSPHLLNRRFDVSEPDRVWVSDITYIHTMEGWLYLSVVIDLFNRKVVGFSMNERITRHLVIDAFRMAIWRRRPAYGLLFHADRGSQYCSRDFIMLLNSFGCKSSMSRKGNCLDNAVAESFFGTLKTELVNNVIYMTRQEARRSIFEYIEIFYNTKRRHSYLGNVSPNDFEKIWRLQNAA